MKTFSKPKQGNQYPFASPKSSNLMMTPHMSRESFENVRLAGRHVGASMITTGGGSGESSGCCSINIYINNDVQGINNSVLVGSDVKMGDPGVSLSLTDVKMDRGYRLVSMRKERDFATQFCWVMLVSVIILAISVFAM